MTLGSPSARFPAHRVSTPRRSHQRVHGPPKAAKRHQSRDEPGRSDASVVWACWEINKTCYVPRLRWVVRPDLSCYLILLSLRELRVLLANRRDLKWSLSHLRFSLRPVTHSCASSALIDAALLPLKSASILRNTVRQLSMVLSFGLRSVTQRLNSWTGVSPVSAP
jgi:hypothetical protein